MGHRARVAAVLAVFAAAASVAAWRLSPCVVTPVGERSRPDAATVPPTVPAGPGVAWVASAPAASAAAPAAVEIAQVGQFPWSGRPAAVLRLSGAAPRTFVVGDSVAPGVRLVRVHDSFVELEDHGRTHRVAVGREGPLATAAPDPAASTAATLEVQPASDVITRGSANAPVHTTPLSRAIERARGG